MLPSFDNTAVLLACIWLIYLHFQIILLEINHNSCWAIYLELNFQYTYVMALRIKNILFNKSILFQKMQKAHKI